MMRYILGNKKACAIPCILQILLFGVQTAIQILLIQIVDAAISKDLKLVTFWVVLCIAAWGLYLLTQLLSEYSQGTAIRKLNNNVRNDIYKDLIRKSHIEYHDLSTGEYLSWLTNDIKQIEQFCWTPFFSLVGQISRIVWSVAALMCLHWSLAILAILSALIMWLLPKFFNKRIQKLSGECAKQQALATADLKDLLSGFDIICFFNKKNRFLQGGDAASDKMERPSYKLKKTKANMTFVIEFSNVVLQLASLLWITFLSFKGIVAVATLVGGTNLIGGVTNGFSNLASLKISLISGKPYFDKITVHAADVEAAPAALPALQQGITVEDLSFCYDEKKPILQHTSIEFKKGGKYALTGPSGCGKSTLLKILLGWLPDYEGTVRFDGHDMRDYSPEQLQQQMSYIEQDVFLFNTSIRENITLGENFSDEEMQKALRDSALAGDLANMPQGLDTPVGEEGSALSGGQKQRVAIARALIHKRSILLVDEGTSALDQKNADIVEKSLLANPDLTLILISHHLSDARKAQFDRVYELKPVALTA